MGCFRGRGIILPATYEFSGAVMLHNPRRSPRDCWRYHAPMLPEDCHWADSLHTETVWFYVGDLCVEAVSCRLDGQWYALVNRHLDGNRRRIVLCSRREVGMKWIERWALGRLGQFRNEQPQGPNSIWTK